MGRRNNDRGLRLRAGKLRLPATIQQATRTQATSGDLSPTSWTTFASTYVEIRPLTGRDLWNAQQIQPDMTHQITCRYVPGVTSSMRVVAGTRVFDVVEPPENIEERNIVLQLMCIEAE